MPVFLLGSDEQREITMAFARRPSEKRTWRFAVAETDAAATAAARRRRRIRQQQQQQQHSSSSKPSNGWECRRSFLRPRLLLRLCRRRCRSDLSVSASPPTPQPKNRVGGGGSTPGSALELRRNEHRRGERRRRGGKEKEARGGGRRRRRPRPRRPRRPRPPPRSVLNHERSCGSAGAASAGVRPQDMLSAARARGNVYRPGSSASRPWPTPARRTGPAHPNASSGGPRGPRADAPAPRHAAGRGHLPRAVRRLRERAPADLSSDVVDIFRLLRASASARMRSRTASTRRRSARGTTPTRCISRRAVNATSSKRGSKRPARGSAWRSV